MAVYQRDRAAELIEISLQLRTGRDKLPLRKSISTPSQAPRTAGDSPNWHIIAQKYHVTTERSASHVTDPSGGIASISVTIITQRRRRRQLL